MPFQPTDLNATKACRHAKQGEDPSNKIIPLPWHRAAGAARDTEAIAAALAETEVEHLAARPYATLSGGERQRVQIARALAQLEGAERPAALLLDEPTASLDAAHRAALLGRLRGLAAGGLAVLVVLHDLNEAAFVADRVAVLAGGRLVACAPPLLALRPEILAAVYGLPFRPIPGGGVVPDFACAPMRGVPFPRDPAGSFTS